MAVAPEVPIAPCRRRRLLVRISGFADFFSYIAAAALGHGVTAAAVEIELPLLDAA